MDEGARSHILWEDASHILREMIKWRELIHGTILNTVRRKLVKVAVNISKVAGKYFPYMLYSSSPHPLIVQARI